VVAWFFEQQPRGLMTIYEDTNSKPCSIYWIGSTPAILVLPIPARFRLGAQCYPGVNRLIAQQLPPAGSILRVRDSSGEPFFQPRLKELLQPTRHTILSARWPAATSPPLPGFSMGFGDHRYYLRNRALIDGADFEDSIGYLRQQTKSRSQSERRSSCKAAAAACFHFSLLNRAGQVFQVGHFRWPVPAKVKSATNWRISFRIWEASVESTALTNTSSSRPPPFPQRTEPAALCTVFSNAEPHRR